MGSTIPFSQQPMKKISITFFISLFLLVGCKKGEIVVTYGSICHFDWDLIFKSLNGGMEVTSNQTEPNVYEFEVYRILLDVKNPPERVKLAIINEETTAVEGEDYHLSTKELLFAKGNRTTSFQLTIMPVNAEKTLTIKLDYTHPQAGSDTGQKTDGGLWAVSDHYAKFRLLP